MKADFTQACKARELYYKGGMTAVYEYAKAEGIDDWSYCEYCEVETPDCDTGECLLCDSVKASGFLPD